MLITAVIFAPSTAITWAKTGLLSIVFNPDVIKAPLDGNG
jgi:hypothetical protein